MRSASVFAMFSAVVLAFAAAPALAQVSNRSPWHRVTRCWSLAAPR